MLEWFKNRDVYEVIWTYYLVDKDDPRLEGKAAVTDVEANCIYVGDCGDDVKIMALTFHEMLHVNWTPPGGTPVLQSIFKTKSEEKTDEIEELLVAYQAPILYAYLIKNGFLKLPDLPSGRKK